MISAKTRRFGVNRTLLAVMVDAYTDKTNDKGETRVILKLKPELAPIKAAVLPLAKNNPDIVALARKIKSDLQPSIRAVYDDTGGIGKLYDRQDEIGTPFCVTSITKPSKTTPSPSATATPGSRNALASMP